MHMTPVIDEGHIQPSGLEARSDEIQEWFGLEWVGRGGKGVLDIRNGNAITGVCVCVWWILGRFQEWECNYWNPSVEVLLASIKQ